MKPFAALLFLLVQLDFILASEDTLQLLHVLYRHGDRTPIHFCKSDSYSDMKFWPEGLGELTKKGMQMEYNRGLWLRKRYGNFINEEFNPAEVEIRSTDYDRTLMSGEAVASAFFFPTNVSSRFNKSVLWTPTPIHSSASGDDKLLNVDAACPRISEEVEKVNNFPEIVKFNEDHKDLYDILSEGCGDDRHSIRKIGFLFDTLLIEKSHGMKLSDWALKYYDEMKKIADYSFVINTLSLELKRLRSGPLIEHFSKQMKKKVKGETPRRRLFMYSAHDSTLSIVMNSMGAFNGLAPPYAATFMLELHKIDSKYFVKMFYHNDTTMTKEAYPIAAAGCDHVCPLEKWTNLVGKLIPDNWDKECYVRNSDKDAFIINILTGLLITVLLMILLFHSWGWYMRRNYRWIELHKANSPYEPIVSSVTPYATYGAV